MLKKKQAKRYPSYLVGSQHTESIGQITPDMIREAYDKLKNREHVLPEFVPMGPFHTCFLTVTACIRNFGGKMVLGWMVDEHSAVAKTCENCFARINLEAHAIWRSPDGRLMEVTNNPEGKCYRFIPHETVQPFTNGGIQFVDSFLLAKTLHHFDPAEEKKIRRIIVHASSGEVRR